MGFPKSITEWKVSMKILLNISGSLHRISVNIVGMGFPMSVTEWKVSMKILLNISGRLHRISNLISGSFNIPQGAVGSPM